MTDALEQTGEWCGKSYTSSWVNLATAATLLQDYFDEVVLRFVVAGKFLGQLQMPALAQAVTTSYMQDGKQVLELIYIYHIAYIKTIFWNSHYTSLWYLIRIPS